MKNGNHPTPEKFAFTTAARTLATALIFWIGGGSALRAQNATPAPAPAAPATAVSAPTTPAADTGTPAPTPVLQIQADQVAAHVSPTLYGLMTEEINHAYDGGLYAELVRNRTFQDNPNEPAGWVLVQDTGANGTMTLDASQPLNDALKTSLKLDIATTGPNQRVGIANEGFWGIPVLPNTTYQASYYAKAGANFNGTITVALVSGDGQTVFASAAAPHLSDAWQKYEVSLTTGNVTPSKDNRLLIWTTSPGTVWFNLVSLFPPTWNDRANGNRRDIMQLLADMHPAFLRLPGGNYLEGNTIATRFDWKKTVGDISGRPGHQDDAWRYFSSDGMGLLEFLEWCEDLHIQPVLAVYAGYSLGNRRAGLAPPHVNPGPDLQPYVQDAVDEIEYVTGNTSTTWGAQRAKDGHPDPFPLKYVEIGNEDQFDRAKTYDARFTQFYDAIKAKYPDLQIIATTPVQSRTPDVIDEHLYPSSEQEMENRAHEFDTRARTGPKIFVGEWATRVGRPTPDLAGALGDAAWMTGMERNSDLVIMGSYAPLFVNVSPGAMQWPTDLIGYDALTSYGSPSYYAQKIFSVNHGDVVLPTSSQNIPTRTWQPPARRGGQPPPPVQVPTLFFDATRNTQDGTIYLKIVNSAAAPQPVQIALNGVTSVAPTGDAVVLSSASLDDTNSIDEPTKVVPVTSATDGLGASFTRTFPPYSITILKIHAANSPAPGAAGG